MKRGLAVAGLVLFGLGAGLAGWVSASGLVRMGELCATAAGGACETARSGVLSSGFVALICASMATLSARGLKRRG